MDLSSWTCPHGPVLMDVSSWNCPHGQILDLSSWTCRRIDTSEACMYVYIFVVSIAGVVNLCVATLEFLGLSEDRAKEYLEILFVIIFLYFCGISGPAHFERQSLGSIVISGCFANSCNHLRWELDIVGVWSAPDVHGHNQRVTSRSHSCRFFDLAGDAIDVSVNLPWYISPTVRHWRTVLAQEHFLGSPSFRWVLLVDMDTEEIVDDDDQVLFPNADVGEESCRFYAIMRHCPALVRRLETAEQRNDYMLALRVIEQYPDQLVKAAARIRNVREIAEAALEKLSNCGLVTYFS